MRYTSPLIVVGCLTWGPDATPAPFLCPADYGEKLPRAGPSFLHNAPMSCLVRTGQDKKTCGASVGPPLLFQQPGPIVHAPWRRWGSDKMPPPAWLLPLIRYELRHAPRRVTLPIPTRPRRVIITKHRGTRRRSWRLSDHPRKGEAAMGGDPNRPGEQPGQPPQQPPGQAPRPGQPPPKDDDKITR